MQKQSVNTAEIIHLLDLGTSAAEAGDWTTARRFFAQVLGREPTNEEALLWQAGLAEDPYETVAYLKLVLNRNPQSKRAKDGIEWALSRLPPDEQQRVRATLPRSEPKAKRSAPPFRYLWSALLRITALFCIAVGGLALTDNLDNLRALVVATARTPTAVSTPTFVPTLTATSTHESTPIASATRPASPTPGPPTAQPVLGEKWIDVDLSAQTLVAYDGAVEVLRTTVSTGAPQTPTVTGRFRIFSKLVSQTIGGNDYVQANVPFIMYFYDDYCLHGAYWHNDFGRAHSHGCVNLPIPDAQWLFQWADPQLPPGASEVWDTVTGKGTLVVIHQ